MITYSFDDKSKISLYEQLYRHIKEDILSGVLAPHTPLPSKRAFSKQLCVSIVTVETSYNQLLSEGFIYSLPRKGFYVSDIGANSGIPVSNAASPTVLPSLAQADLDKLKVTVDTSSKYYADFSSNATDPDSFPFTIWAKITRQILADNQHLLMTNPPFNGLLELRQAIVDYLREFRGMQVHPDNIIIGAGTETMYNLLIQLLGHDKVYATEDPGYDKIAKILISNEVPHIKVPLDEHGILPSFLEQHGAQIVHSTPSHHFPTGITMPIKRRHELLNWATADPEGHRYIIEDDYDSEFRLLGRPIPSLYSIDRSERVIYMNTFTKSLASTIRVSYMILPEHLMQLYRKKMSFYTCTVSTFEQLTLALLMYNGHYEKHINRMRTASRKKRDLLLTAIRQSTLAPFCEIKEEQAGLHFILRLNIPKKRSDFLAACEKREIHITAVASNSYMINYSSIPKERIEEAVNRLALAALES